MIKSRTSRAKKSKSKPRDKEKDETEGEEDEDQKKEFSSIKEPLASSIKRKRAAAKLFNSAALPTEVFEREREGKFLADFLSLYSAFFLPSDSGTKSKQSRTLYICGKPGTGKTATLGCALKALSPQKDLAVLMFNAMNYASAKEFMVAICRKTCRLAEQEFQDAKELRELSAIVHENIKAADVHVYAGLRDFV